MSDLSMPGLPGGHSHIFLGQDHGAAERRTWAVIALCTVMMVAEIVGGLLFGSIALVADGLHMSTHAGALLLAALAYSFARRYAADPRFTFGTGKLGDLAGFTSAIALAMIALLIGYEAVIRLFSPVTIQFGDAIPIACFGLAVNVASAWLLSGGHHHHAGHAHGHEHGHGHAPGGHDHDEAHRIATPGGPLALSVFEHDHPPVFRMRAQDGALPAAAAVTIETVRPDGARQVFALEDHGLYLQSREEIPEPHAFTAHVRVDGRDHPVVFAEHSHDHDAHGAVRRDNNMRAAIVHVIADAAVSVLVIVGLTLASLFGWLWMDPLAGIVGALVIGSWSYGLVRDTGAILLDMEPDTTVKDGIRRVVEEQGDRVADLHVWRLGPGHLGAIVSVVTERPRGVGFYRERLAGFQALSHLTVEIQHAA
jgi:cation diffusion facilitator family transporter